MNAVQEFVKSLAANMTPDQFIPKDRVDALLKTGGSVDLTLDGDHACALLGEDLQIGEAEFVKISDHEKGDGYDNAAKRATVRALRLLTARCYPDGNNSLPYNVCRHSVMSGT